MNGTHSNMSCSKEQQTFSDFPVSPKEASRALLQPTTVSPEYSNTFTPQVFPDPPPLPGPPSPKDTDSPMTQQSMQEHSDIEEDNIVSPSSTPQYSTAHSTSLSSLPVLTPHCSLSPSQQLSVWGDDNYVPTTEELMAAMLIWASLDEEAEEDSRADRNKSSESLMQTMKQHYPTEPVDVPVPGEQLTVPLSDVTGAREQRTTPPAESRAPESRGWRRRWTQIRESFRRRNGTREDARGGRLRRLAARFPRQGRRSQEEQMDGQVGARMGPDGMGVTLRGGELLHLPSQAEAQPSNQLSEAPLEAYAASTGVEDDPCRNTCQ